MTSVFFFSFLYSKLQKVALVFKKGSKLNYISYCPISLLSNIEKILENLMYERFYNFLETMVLSITYSLDSDNNILHLVP